MVSRSHLEGVLRVYKCVTIIVLLGKIAHSNFKENVPLCGPLNLKVFIDQVCPAAIYSSICFTKTVVTER